jgi:hypothetical protein
VSLTWHPYKSLECSLEQQNHSGVEQLDYWRLGDVVVEAEAVHGLRLESHDCQWDWRGTVLLLDIRVGYDRRLYRFLLMIDMSDHAWAQDSDRRSKE